MNRATVAIIKNIYFCKESFLKRRVLIITTVDYRFKRLSLPTRESEGKELSQVSLSNKLFNKKFWKMGKMIPARGPQTAFFG